MSVIVRTCWLILTFRRLEGSANVPVLDTSGLVPDWLDSLVSYRLHHLLTSDGGLLRPLLDAGRYYTRSIRQVQILSS